jgi:hypothetical protein
METINGVTNPIVGTVAISDGSLVSLTVTALIRYNGSGRFTCSVTDNGTFFGTMDVYWNTDNARFQAKEYIPERYRDEEGVNKKM